MNIVGSTADGSPNVSPKTGGSFTGLATGMVISPCVVFPNGATIVDLRISGTEAFEASVNASEESYLYSFKVQETTVMSFSFAVTHPLIAKVTDPDAATNTALFSFSGVSSVAAVVGAIGGGAIEFGFVATDAMRGDALMSKIRRLEMGFTSVHLLACVAALKSKKTEFLSLDRTHSLTCSASLKVRRAESLSFSYTNKLTCVASMKLPELLGVSITHQLTPKAKLTVPPVILMTLKYNFAYEDPYIVWDTRYDWWTFSDRVSDYPYRNPIDRANMSRSKTSPVAALTIT